MAGACCWVTFSNPIYPNLYNTELRSLNISSTGAKPLILTKLSWDSNKKNVTITRYSTTTAIKNDNNTMVYPYIAIDSVFNSTLAVAESLFIYNGTGYTGVDFHGHYYNDYNDYSD